MSTRATHVFLMCMAVLAGAVSGATAQPRGIVGRQAPSWRVDQWFNLPDGQESIDLADYRGKVVYLYGFQSWCPGCHSHGFPTLRDLIKRFDGADDVAFVAVQTTFEGFHTNTADNALKTAEKYDLDIPVGHSGSDGQRSKLMSDYRTGGTPWTVVIDRAGVVRFNGFRITTDRAERLINQLRDEPQKIQTLPEDRGGQDMIGKRFPKVEFDRWIRHDRRWPASESVAGETGQPAANSKPKATLYRWWTDSCPYCEASLPAIERLRKEYADDGLRIVAVYHPKPPREVDDEAIATAADERGFHGAVALDQDWSVLKRFYLSTGSRRATSASFLVDANGVIRFVHPGPVFFPSDEPRFARHNEDYQLIEQAIRQLLRADAGNQ